MSWVRAEAAQVLRQFDAEFDEHGAFALLARAAILDQVYRQAVLSNTYRAIFEVVPWLMSERVTIQQGHFVVAGDIRVPFVENLPAGGPAGALKKIEIPASARVEALKHLPDALIEEGVTVYSGDMGDILAPEEGACPGRSVTSWTSVSGSWPGCWTARR